MKKQNTFLKLKASVMKLPTYIRLPLLLIVGIFLYILVGKIATSFRQKLAMASAKLGVDAIDADNANLLQGKAREKVVQALAEYLKTEYSHIFYDSTDIVNKLNSELKNKQEVLLLSTYYKSLTSKSLKAELMSRCRSEYIPVVGGKYSQLTQLIKENLR